MVGGTFLIHITWSPEVDVPTVSRTFKYLFIANVPKCQV